MKIKHKICSNCGALMIYNDAIDIYHCLICGNSESLENKQLTGKHGYIG